MAAGKFDLKDALIEAFYTAKALVSQLVDDFRSRDRYFKYKAGIIAAWLALSAGTLGVSCAAGAPHQNSLHAVTQVTQVVGEYTLFIRNDSDEDWNDVWLTLNGSYRAHTPLIGRGDHYVIPAKQFVGAHGALPAKDLKPRSLRIRCSSGSDTLDLTQAARAP